MRNAGKFLSQALATFVLVAGAVVLLAGVLVPRLTGADTYAVLAHSMSPRYPIGTLLVVRPAQTAAVGDVVTYQLRPDDPAVVTHRVVAISSTLAGEPRYTTQGDANAIPDAGLVQPEQIRGVLWYAIPFAGYLVVALNSGQQYASVGVAGLLAAYALWQIIRTVSEKRIGTKKSDVIDNPNPPEKDEMTNSKASLADFEKLAAQVERALAEMNAITELNRHQINANSPVPESPIPVEVFSAGTMAAKANSVSANPSISVDLGDVESFRPTMTRAERRRLQTAGNVGRPEYSLVS